ncbi:hypothetical protein QFZ49_003243 [Streptomyces turgidiscabies]|uniref:Transposase IS4-like domain-containing protein n=1 Tax=Streptomyces turgidiscabies TaxID=85558 RepID=A0ABU0RNJ8_9ACTN|nr:hypothetical protein [Streptomyces turgidiscabies]
MFVLTEGQTAGSPQFIPVFKKLRVRGPVGHPCIRPDAVAGDKAYTSYGNRAHLRKRRIKAVIPEKKGQGSRPVGHDADLYKERNTVERLINKLKAAEGQARHRHPV